jgi:hypothetical protein
VACGEHEPQQIVADVVVELVDERVSHRRGLGLARELLAGRISKTSSWPFPTPWPIGRRFDAFSTRSSQTS